VVSMTSMFCTVISLLCPRAVYGYSLIMQQAGGRDEQICRPGGSSALPTALHSAESPPGACDSGGKNRLRPEAAPQVLAGRDVAAIGNLPYSSPSASSSS
jgi:hypothetical protein